MKPRGRKKYKHASSKHHISGAERRKGYKGWWEDVVEPNKKMARQNDKKMCEEPEDELSGDDRTLDDINTAEDEYVLMSEPEAEEHLLNTVYDLKVGDLVYIDHNQTSQPWRWKGIEFELIKEEKEMWQMKLTKPPFKKHWWAKQLIVKKEKWNS